MTGSNSSDSAPAGVNILTSILSVNFGKNQVNITLLTLARNTANLSCAIKFMEKLYPDYLD